LTLANELLSADGGAVALAHNTSAFGSMSSMTAGSLLGKNPETGRTRGLTGYVRDHSGGAAPGGLQTHAEDGPGAVPSLRPGLKKSGLRMSAAELEALSRD